MPKHGITRPGITDEIIDEVIKIYSNGSIPNHISVMNAKAVLEDERYSPNTIVKGIAAFSLKANSESDKPVRSNYFEAVIRSEAEREHINDKKSKRNIAEALGEKEVIDFDRMAESIVDREIALDSELWKKDLLSDIERSITDPNIKLALFQESTLYYDFQVLSNSERFAKHNGMTTLDVNFVRLCERVVRLRRVYCMCKKMEFRDMQTGERMPLIKKLAKERREWIKAGQQQYHEIHFTEWRLPTTKEEPQQQDEEWQNNYSF